VPAAEVNVYEALTGFAGLQALVSTRIYPSVMPQDVDKPAVVYFRVVGNREVLLADGGGSGVERVLFQFTSWAKSMSESYAVAEQVRLALAAASFETVVQVNRSGYEPDTRLFSFTYDIAIWHR